MFSSHEKLSCFEVVPQAFKIACYSHIVLSRCLISNHFSILIHVIVSLNEVVLNTIIASPN